MALFLSGFFQVIEEGPEASEEYYRKWVDTVKAVVPEERLLVFDVKQVWQIRDVTILVFLEPDQEPESLIVCQKRIKI